MYRNISKISVFVLVLFGLASCLTSNSATTETAAREIIPMREPDILINTAESWGGKDLAGLEYDFDFENVKALKMSQDYGATMLVYHFTGFEPGQKLDINLDVNIYLTESSGWVELFWEKGLFQSSTDAWNKRGDDEKWGYFGVDGYKRKWESGGKDPEKRILGTSSRGWVHIADSSQADENGDFTFAIQAGHWEESPAFIEEYFANLKVSPSVE
ncbi:MAG: hypothetical protein JXR86_18175 [Spirochaetales bacterium]|nr:hypothetical protein [Spirochaetales bacterium]